MTDSFVLDGPFGDRPIAEVLLPRAPLALTLAQIRFPNQTSLTVDESIAHRVALALADLYPVLNVEQAFELLLTPDGVDRRESSVKVWRVSSADQTWRVGFSANFLSLETSAYTNRDEFCSRLETVWERFSAAIGAPVIQRIGFRYVNRVQDLGFLNGLTTMVRPEVMGATFAGGPVAPIVRSLTEHLYAASATDQLLVRWGVLPPGDTLDPAAIPALAGVSWLLDIDSFRNFDLQGQDPPVDVASTVRELGHVAYRYFRWAVTNNFLEHFGGVIQ